MKQYSYFKRDLSWLSFNERVLQEAADKRVPLYNRIKFLAIFSSNLDEFYRVRVSTLRRFKQLKRKKRKSLIADINPKKELRNILDITNEQLKQFGKIFKNHILPELAENHIQIVEANQFNHQEIEFAKNFFQTKIKNQISTSIIDTESPSSIPFLENKRIYFVVSFQDDYRHLGIIPFPKELDRFLVFPKTSKAYHITLIDEIIRANIEDILPNRSVKGIYAIKTSRDAELYIEDEFSGDLVEKIKNSLSNRETGLPTRFLYDTYMPVIVLRKLQALFNLSHYDLIDGGRYHNFNDFFDFPDPTKNKDLHDIALPPLKHPELPEKKSLLKAIRKKDYILHFPYQSYQYIPKLILDAANDNEIDSIRVTLYRVSSNSAVAKALLKALEAGKKVIVFVEIKARFDEASNLYWGNELKKAGATVLYSYPGIKVHTKLLQIQSSPNKKGVINYYTYLGTGNFNEKTAKVYCDHALLTSHEGIGKETAQVFDILMGKNPVFDNKHLFVAPFNLKNRFIELVNHEIALAQAGKPAYMILKMNSLENLTMINKLYEASNAGVKIKLIVRGICCLVPGVIGQSDNIEVISLVDRFLEHARVYIFGNGGNEKMYISSADWMTRNLLRRIEVAIPIYNEKIFEELREIINLQLMDNSKARLIDEMQTNPYKKYPIGSTIQAQTDIYHFLKGKSEKD